MLREHYAIILRDAVLLRFCFLLNPYAGNQSTAKRRMRNNVVSVNQSVNQWLVKVSECL